MTDLYCFEELEKFVESVLGRKLFDIENLFPKINKKLNSLELEENIEFKTDGIYYKIGDNKVKGFLYIEKGYNQPYEDENGRLTIVPRFHIRNCEVIQRMKRYNRFNRHYTFANYPVKMKDIDDIEKDLKLCRYCLGMTSVIDRVITTLEYFEKYILNDESTIKFGINDLPTNNIGIDYPINWALISQRIRKRRDYICEKCGISLSNNYYNRYYIEVHHIDGNKNNNNENNLQVLCVLCHAFTDNKHIENYTKKEISKIIKIKNFLYEYKDEIIKHNEDLYRKALNIVI